MNGPNTECKRCREYGWDCQYAGQECSRSTSPSAQAQSLSPSPSLRQNTHMHTHMHTQIRSSPYGRPISHSAPNTSRRSPLQLDEPSMFLESGLSNGTPLRNQSLPTHFHNLNTQTHASHSRSQSDMSPGFFDFSDSQATARIAQPIPYNPLPQIAPPTFTESPTGINNSFGDLPQPGGSYGGFDSTDFAQFSMDDRCVILLGAIPRHG